MQKKFITNFFFLIFMNILIKPFWIFGIDRVVQNTTGAAEYGLYSSLLSFSFLLNILLDLGITNYNVRNIAQHSHLLKKHFSSIVVLRILLAVIYIGISLIAGWIMDYDSRRLSILLILLFNQVLASFTLYLRSNISGLQLFKTESIISVLDRTLMIIFCSVLLWSGWFSKSFPIEYFVWAQTLAYFLTAIITFIIVAKKAKFNKLSWNLQFFLVILKQSYPFAILILLMGFYTNVDSVMIERLLPDGAFQAGIYAQARRLMDAANQFPYLISILLLPMFSSMIRKKEFVEDLVELSFSIIAIPSIILMALSVFYNEQLMTALYHQHVKESALILRVIMNCFLAFSSVYIFGTLLTANGSLRYLNYIALGGMILNISLNYYYIPIYGPLGAAMVALVTQYITAGAQMLLVHHIFKFTYRWWLFSRYALFTASTFILFSFLQTLPIKWIFSCIAGVLLSIALSFAFFLIRPRSIIRLIRQPGQN
ncbi:MAG: oligosaccharide flippase family protein [Bacteroidota bacterium]